MIPAPCRVASRSGTAWALAAAEAAPIIRPANGGGPWQVCGRCHASATLPARTRDGCVTLTHASCARLLPATLAYEDP
jgi:hypothetical protein